MVFLVVCVVLFGLQYKSYKGAKRRLGNAYVVIASIIFDCRFGLGTHILGCKCFFACNSRAYSCRRIDCIVFI